MRYEKKFDQSLRVVNYVPTEHAEKLRQALGEAGAGRIGNYSHCSFSVEGVGRFLGNENSSPGTTLKLVTRASYVLNVQQPSARKGS